MPGIFSRAHGGKKEKKKGQCGLLRGRWRSGQAVHSADRIRQAGPFCSSRSQHTPPIWFPDRPRYPPKLPSRRRAWHRDPQPSLGRSYSRRQPVGRHPAAPLASGDAWYQPATRAQTRRPRQRRWARPWAAVGSPSASPGAPAFICPR